MKLYKTIFGIVVEKNERFYLNGDENWDAFINDDMLFQKLNQRPTSF